MPGRPEPLVDGIDILRVDYVRRHLGPSHLPPNRRVVARCRNTLQNGESVCLFRCGAAVLLPVCCTAGDSD